MRCIEVQEYARGKIVRARFYYDALSLLRQLGVVEDASAEPEFHEEIES
jgi:hypothetical protein